jgi:hypothetical protein
VLEDTGMFRAGAGTECTGIWTIGPMAKKLFRNLQFFHRSLHRRMKTKVTKKKEADAGCKLGNLFYYCYFSRRPRA